MFDLERFVLFFPTGRRKEKEGRREEAPEGGSRTQAKGRRRGGTQAQGSGGEEEVRMRGEGWDLEPLAAEQALDWQILTKTKLNSQNLRTHAQIGRGRAQTKG